MWHSKSVFRIDFLIPFLVLFLVSGCAPSSPTIASPALNFGSLPDSAILQRARVWVDNKVPYGSFDNNSSNDSYQGYRADCSGFVSYAWGLGQPGLDTTALLSGDSARQIDIADLAPGDALNNGKSGKDGHIVLFVEWTNRATHTFISYDENIYPGYASQKTYTLIPILNTGRWTIREIDHYAPGPYYAEHLITANDLPFAGVPPKPGLYSINKAFATQPGWNITLDSIEVRNDGTLKVTYSWTNTSSGSQSLSGSDQVRILVEQHDGSTLDEQDTNCGSGNEFEAAPNGKISCWSTVGVLQDGTNPFSVVYVGVGQVDRIVLTK